MLMRSRDNSPAGFLILSLALAVGLGIFLVLVGGTSDVEASAVAAGYLVGVLGLLWAVGTIASGELRHS